MSESSTSWEHVVHHLLGSELRATEELRRRLAALRDSLPEGRFDEESGEPLDLAGHVSSIGELVDEEFLAPTVESLSRMRRWLQGEELPPRV